MAAVWPFQVKPGGNNADQWKEWADQAGNLVLMASMQQAQPVLATHRLHCGLPEMCTTTSDKQASSLK